MAVADEEQARYDREFLIIVLCHVWREQVRPILPILRHLKPVLDARRERTP